MRPPPASGGYNETKRSGRNITGSFNEAAARKRRIRYQNRKRTEEYAASMRPPPASGGYPRLVCGAVAIDSASMRPPPASGGYGFFQLCGCDAYCSFNEAAARKRRILNDDAASVTDHIDASMRPPPASGGYVNNTA